jgi:hypothetical protein
VPARADGTEAGPELPSDDARAAYGRIVGIVVGIVALIVAALYVARGSQPGSIHLSTVPTNVDVSVNGEPVDASSSPFVLSELDPEVPHTLEVSKEGYRSWVTTLTVRSGQILELPVVALEPLAEEGDEPEPAASGEAQAAKGHGEAAEQQPPEAEPQSESDDEAGGQAQADATREVQQQDTEREARAVAEQAQQRTEKRPRRKVRRAASKKRRKSASRDATTSGGGTGTLRINSRPWSVVTVDGRKVGNTPQTNLQLGAGTHTIRLHNPDFGLSKTLRVRVKSGQVVTKIVNLQ